MFAFFCFVVLLVVVLIGGMLIYRNNQKKLNAIESTGRDAAKKIRDL